MVLISEIKDKELLPIHELIQSHRIRRAARSILFNEHQQIALLYVSRDHYHKLPGGGIEGNEDKIQALQREVLEEVGATILIQDEIGFIIEHRFQFKQVQYSYYYFGEVVGKIKPPKYTHSEMKSGFKLKWVTIDEAIELLKQDEPSNYVGKFISKRDRIALEFAKEKMSVSK